MMRALVALVVLVGLGAAGYAMLASADVVGGTARVRTADVVKASVMDFDITTKATGELQAKSQIELRSELETNSTIVEIVDEGTFVSKGEVLVKLNEDEVQVKVEEQQLQLEEEKSELSAAQNNLEIQKSENESARRQANLDVELAELDLAQWREGTVKQTRLANELAVEKAQRDLERLRDKVERNKSLLAKKFISKEQSDLDLIALREAEAALKQAVLQREIYETYTYPKEEKSKLSALEEAKAELERVERQNAIELSSREADLIREQRSVSIHKERLAKLKKQLASCTIRAPTDGLVVYGTSSGRSWRYDDQGPLQIGRQVRPNELLIVLPDTNEMMAEVRVPESVAGRVQPGQSATVSVNAIGGSQFSGEVVSKGVLAESGGWRDPNSREYTVRIAIESGDGIERLKPSMRSEAEIRLGRVEQSLAVPVTALFRDGAVSYVFEPRGNRFRRTPVKMGRRSNTYVEIAAGLEEGDDVLVREPAAAEVIREPWDTEELRLVGLTLDDEGKPTRIAGERPANGARNAGEAPVAANQKGRSEAGAAVPDDQVASDRDQQPAGGDAVAEESEANETSPEEPVAASDAAAEASPSSEGE